MTNRTEVALVIHDMAALRIEVDAWDDTGAILSITAEDGTVIRFIADDCAALTAFLMRQQNGVAAEAARSAEPDRTLPPCDSCGSEPVCVIDGPVRMCAGCALVALEVTV